jgi:hypothetical protein
LKNWDKALDDTKTTCIHVIENAATDLFRFFLLILFEKNIYLDLHYKYYLQKHNIYHVCDFIFTTIGFF